MVCGLELRIRVCEPFHDVTSVGADFLRLRRANQNTRRPGEAGAANRSRSLIGSAVDPRGAIDRLAQREKRPTVRMVSIKLAVFGSIIKRAGTCRAMIGRSLGRGEAIPRGYPSQGRTCSPASESIG
jgi:hypothetical protein